MLTVDLTADPRAGEPGWAQRALFMAVLDGHAGEETVNHLTDQLVPNLLAAAAAAGGLRDKPFVSRRRRCSPPTEGNPGRGLGGGGKGGGYGRGALWGIWLHMVASQRWGERAAQAWGRA